MFSKGELNKRILISITGKTDKDWKLKLKDIEKYDIRKIGLFLEFFGPRQKREIYESLLDSHIDEIPFVHARNDMKKEEFIFLKNHFNSKYFSIHENSFKYLPKWKDLNKDLFLEFNYDNKIPHDVVVEKIGGFCVDLSHFKAAEEKWAKEFEYVLKRRKVHKYFKCNHLNGYSYSSNSDLHTVKSLRSFDYLRTLPKFVFGDAIALEVFNSIPRQIEFKEYLIDFLGK